MEKKKQHYNERWHIFILPIWSKFLRMNFQ